MARPRLNTFSQGSVSYVRKKVRGGGKRGTEGEAKKNVPYLLAKLVNVSLVVTNIPSSPASPSPTFTSTTHSALLSSAAPTPSTALLSASALKPLVILHSECQTTHPGFLETFRPLCMVVSFLGSNKRHCDLRSGWDVAEGFSDGSICAR